MESHYSCSCLSHVVGRRLACSYNYGKLQPDQSRDKLLAPHPSAELARSNYRLPLVFLSQLHTESGLYRSRAPSGWTSICVTVQLHKLASVAGLRSRQGFYDEFFSSGGNACITRTKQSLAGCLLQVEYECNGSWSARAAAQSCFTSRSASSASQASTSSRLE